MNSPNLAARPGPNWSNLDGVRGDRAARLPARTVIGRPRSAAGRRGPWCRAAPAHSVLLAEVARTQAGTLALRGPDGAETTPSRPARSGLNIPHLKADGHGFVDNPLCLPRRPAVFRHLRRHRARRRA